MDGSRPIRFADDRIGFGPDDVDLSRSPLRNGVSEPTYVLGAFNPGFTRLPNGNLLMMVRVAEALRHPVDERHVSAIRWQAGGYVVDRHPASGADLSDPRKITLKGYAVRTELLTSLSWLLPVELSADASHILAVHYDRAIGPSAPYAAYGIEDARISRIDDRWYMTVCAVSAERHCTVLYTSPNGLDWTSQGIVLDHQNKDMLLFEGKIADRFFALTRPMGELYFAYPPGDAHLPGPSINLATSPDALHWKPWDTPCLRPRRGDTPILKIGGGAPPVLTPDGWLAIYHGVEVRGAIGIYRTYWAMLDACDPSRVLRIEDARPLLESRPDLTADLAARKYLHDVVYTCGAAPDLDPEWLLLASGEDDLCCRLTRVPMSTFDA